jgi:hypothetical protein
LYSSIKKIYPAVDRKFLIIFAGLIWAVVGLFLCKLAIKWISTSQDIHSVWLIVSGVILSLLIHHLGFLRLVKQNTKRILSLEDKTCIFAFQPVRSYFIILIMVIMGMILRHSPIPKPYLSIIYIGFGGAMFLSGLRYLWEFLKLFLTH